ncbi:MAG: cytochrome c [Acidimicrobiia bacterium]|nr:cytochrome c [Acidimicrobiia bacterium]
MTPARLKLQFALIGVLSLILFTSASFAQRVEPTAENIGKGETIFKKHCQACHGATGMGDGPAGKRMNPKPYNFRDKEKMAGHTDEQLLKAITKGEGPMPPFERKLRENERWMVLHYIRSLSK